VVFGTDFDETDLPLKLHVHCDPEERFQGGNYSIGIKSGFAPTAAFVINPKFEEELPATITFDASTSSDPDNDIVSYEWSYDDATEDNPIVTDEPILELLFTQPGAYEVNLKVRDSKNYVAFAEDVMLLGPNPFDEIEPNDTAQPLDPLKAGGWKGNVGRATNVDILYDGSRYDRFSLPVGPGQSARFVVETTAGDKVFVQDLSYFDPAKNSGLSLFWDSAYQLKNNNAAEQSFVVEVGEGFSDNDGGDYTLRWFVGTEPSQPVIEADVTSGPAPLTVNFTATATDSDGTVESIEWDFNKDRVVDATGPSVSHTFTETGTQRIDVLIMDDDHLRNGASKTVSVQ
jgi:hypothetical protein